MSYTKLTSFTPKDTLLSGNPNKLVRGSELDAEFDAIAAAYSNVDNTSDATKNAATATLTNKTLVAPALGAATATSVNKVSLTAPATGSTLTIADGKTLTVPLDATVSGTNTGDQTNITGNAATATNVSVGGITGLGTGVATALAVNVGSAGAPVVLNGAGGTPSSITLTNATGTAASLTAGLASGLTGTPNITVGSVTANGDYSGLTNTNAAITFTLSNTNSGANAKSALVFLADTGATDQFLVNQWSSTYSGGDLCGVARPYTTTLTKSGNNHLVLGTLGTGNLVLGANNATVGVISSTGLAVTGGALSAMGIVTPGTFTTGTRPTKTLGGIIFDTTLNKLLIGGASAWEAVTSV